MTFIPNLDYPDSDGLPMADNTQQYEWIVKIKENLEILFAANPDVFVAGDLLWYYHRDPKTYPPIAPDVMVAFGRPKGKRGSYKQWEEGNIPPQVVFEILSPSNSIKEMERKYHLYENLGVEEYYVINPEGMTLQGWLRQEGVLQVINPIQGWVSPLLGIRFHTLAGVLEIYHPDGSKFLTPVELRQWVEVEKQRADLERQQAEAERQRAEAETQRADLEKQRAEAETQRADLEKQRAEAETQRADLEKQRAEAETQRADLEKQRADKLAQYLRSIGVDPSDL